MSAAKPQVNIMQPHVKKEYLGFSFFSPSTTSPYFEKAMYMKGVGYKASVKGNIFTLVVGFSHDVVMEIPAGLTVTMGETPTEFTISGVDKNLLGQFADKIHKIRKADPYKGKGIFYKDEYIRRKEGKKK